MENQSTSVQPIPTSPVRPRGPIIAAVIVGILILAGGTFAYTQLIHKPAPSPSPTASATPNTVSDWKTYSNTQYGFELKYPRTWGAPSVQANNTPDYPADGFYVNFSCPEIVIGGASACAIYGAGYPATSEESFIKDHFTPDGGDLPTTTISSPSFSTLNGFRIAKVKTYFSGYYQSKSTVIFGNTLYFELSDGDPRHEEDPTLDQILSTLTFTNSTHTSSLTTYTDSYYGFEFQYPSRFTIGAESAGITINETNRGYAAVINCGLCSTNTPFWNPGNQDVLTYTRKANLGYNSTGETIVINGLSFAHFQQSSRQAGTYDDFFVIHSGKLYKVSLYPDPGQGNMDIQDTTTWQSRLLSTFRFTK